MSIAREVELEDPFENMGAQLVKEVATKTNDIAGDGTTTATVLAQAIVKAGLRNVAAGANPMALQRGIDKAVEAAVESIAAQAKEIDDKSEIAQVASISAADAAIGEVIADAIDKVGKDGVVTVEESNTFGIELEFTEGMLFDKGYLSPYFVTDAERQEAVLENPYILFNAGKISSVQDLLPVLEKVMQTGQAAADHRRGRRGRGPRHPRRQQDPRHVQLGRRQGPRASASAARRCSRTWPSSPAARSSPRRSASSSTAPPSTCSARPTRSSSPRTRPPSSAARAVEADVDGRIAQIKQEIENTDSDWDREKLQERLAKLAGGVAVVKVGAATEVELKEKKHRIEDAVSATKAAIEEGVVPGGGTALPAGQAAIEDVIEQARGRRGHRRPHRADGASRPRPVPSPRTPARRARSSSSGSAPRAGNVGFNAATGEFEDLVKAGVIDPAKVTRAALQNAASIAGLLLTTEAVVADKPEPASAAPAMPPRRRWHGRHGRHGLLAQPDSFRRQQVAATAICCRQLRLRSTSTRPWGFARAGRWPDSTCSGSTPRRSRMRRSMNGSTKKRSLVAAIPRRDGGEAVEGERILHRAAGLLDLAPRHDLLEERGREMVQEVLHLVHLPVTPMVSEPARVPPVAGPFTGPRDQSPTTKTSPAAPTRSATIGAVNPPSDWPTTTRSSHVPRSCDRGDRSIGVGVEAGLVVARRQLDGDRAVTGRLEQGDDEVPVHASPPAPGIKHVGRHGGADDRRGTDSAVGEHVHRPRSAA